MSTIDIAKKLVELCQQDHIEEARKMYSPDAVSIEAMMPNEPAKGLEAIRAKGEWWRSNHEVHALVVSGPWPSGGPRFLIRFEYEVTNKPSGQRMKLDIMGLYTVENEKIVREEFFYET